jgi:hypothetical protein
MSKIRIKNYGIFKCCKFATKCAANVGPRYRKLHCEKMCLNSPLPDALFGAMCCYTDKNYGKEGKNAVILFIKERRL